MKKAKVKDIIFYSVCGAVILGGLIAFIVLEVRVQHRWDEFEKSHAIEWTSSDVFE